MRVFIHIALVLAKRLGLRRYCAALCFLLLVSLTTRIASAQDLADSVNAWMRENLDDELLQHLGEVDGQQVRGQLAELNRRLQSANLYDLGDLKEGATALLQFLRQFEETKSYASWLETHLDYFTVADELKRIVPPPKAPTISNAPPLNLQEQVWSRQLEHRPTPARAEKHLPTLKQIFTSQGLPPALVWVAEVESSFDPNARSPAGAVGLFQLMPATAKSLGLSLVPRDERLDGQKSARAASKYLRHLYGRFGDWRLALAAYNAGEGRVQTLLERQKTRSYAAIASRLPAETQMYVPKVEAVIRKREGISLSTLRLSSADSSPNLH